MRKVIEVRNLYKLYRVGDEFVPLLWLAGASVLLVHCPGGLLVLPGVPSVQADTLAAILTVKKCISGNNQ